MAKRLTHYDILGARRSDTHDALRDAWLRAQKRYHPDLALSEEDRARREAASRLINESYALLRDPAQRAIYEARLGRPRPRMPAFDFAALTRSRGTWLLRVPLPGLPQMPLRQRIEAVLSEIWLTRGGQWALLMLAIFVIWVTRRSDPLLPLWLTLTATGIGALLARGGPPTPASDAESLLSALSRSAALLVAAGWNNSRSAGSRVQSLRNEYQPKEKE